MSNPVSRSPARRTALATAALGLLWACAVEVAEKPDRRSVSFPMERFGNRPVVQVSLNGTGPYPFILDTGAPVTLVDSTLARNLGLPVVGQMELGSPLGAGTSFVGQVRLNAVEIAGLSFADQPAALLDLVSLMPGDGSPRGILSYRVFDGHRLTLDFPASEIRALPGHLSLDTEGVTEYYGDIPEVTVEAAGQRISVHLDTGSPAALTLPLAVAATLPLEAGPEVIGRGRTVGGEFEVYGAALSGALRVGPLQLEGPQIQFVEGTAIGNIGNQVLSQVVVTLDPANRRVRLEPSAVPASPALSLRGERKRYGIRFHGLDASPIRVAGVDPGSPAELAGLHRDDLITSLNGTPVEEMGQARRIAALRAERLEMEVLRGDRLRPLVMSLD